MHVPLRVVEDIDGGTVLELWLAAPAGLQARSWSTSAWWSTDMTAMDVRTPGQTDGPLALRKLVVIGNGMAGARTVEEILARGGSDEFAITMFGDEPYGNYNRILLSHVLSGEEQDNDIFLNSPALVRRATDHSAFGRPDHPHRPLRPRRVRRRRHRHPL